MWRTNFTHPGVWRLSGLWLELIFHSVQLTCIQSGFIPWGRWGWQPLNFYNSSSSACIWGSHSPMSPSVERVRNQKQQQKAYWPCRFYQQIILKSLLGGEMGYRVTEALSRRTTTEKLLQPVPNHHLTWHSCSWTVWGHQRTRQNPQEHRE